jgi:FlaA1/EpsC-like NDP-sugar epimerase
MGLPAVWLALLGVRGCYEQQVLSTTDGRRGVVVTGAVLVVVLAALAHLLAAPLPRALLPALALPLVAGSILVRRTTRCRLHRERRRGHGLRRVLVVGHPEPAAVLIEALDAVPECGLVAVGACLPFDGTPGTPGYGLPMTADVTEVLAMADELEVAAVALGSDLDLSGLAGRRLLDALAERGTDLLAVPGIDTAQWAPQVAPVPGAPVLVLSRRPPG